jgi:hypothetical protein
MGMTDATPGRSGESTVVPGHRDKYALVERERRFLVAGLPPGGAGAASRGCSSRRMRSTSSRRRAAGWSLLAGFGLGADGS